jgi:hypothetical protein
LARRPVAELSATKSKIAQFMQRDKGINPALMHVDWRYV